MHPVPHISAVRGPSYHCHDKRPSRSIFSPLRLFDCLGLTIPAFFFAGAAGLGRAVAFRFAGGGSGAGLRTGEARKAVGDGIVMVSIVTASYRETSTVSAVGGDAMVLWSR